MKAVFLRPRFALTALALLASAALVPQRTNAQATGKTGTTIVFDKANSTGLYASDASKSNKEDQWFAYLRHNIAHIQIQSSNEWTLGTNGAGTFAENHNDMLFEKTSDGNYDFQVANFYGSNGSYKKVVLAVIAPKGYRFTRYQWEVDDVLKDDESVETASMCQYTYGDNNSIVPLADSVMLKKGFKWDVTLSNGSNVLYFRISAGQDAQLKTNFKSLKLTYVIDQPFDSQLPATDLSNNIHTGLLDLGTFSYKDAVGYPVFEKTYVATDQQSSNFYYKREGESSSTSSVTPSVVAIDGNQYYVAASNGDYYIEAPEKFRVIGATLNFKKVSSATSYTYTDVTSISSGSSYLISDGNGHYLILNNGSIALSTDAATATLWTISSSGNSYTIKSGSYYLRHNNNSLSASSSSSSSSWNYSNGFYYTTTDRSGNTIYYYLNFNGTAWTIGNKSTVDKLQTRTTGTSITGGDFTAKTYSREGTEQTGDDKTATISDENTTKTITLTDYNNDAIHFNISGLNEGQSAFYNVSLQLLPLNPELQNLSVAAKTKSSDDATTETFANTTSFSSENFVFNNGNTVTLIVPSTTTGEVDVQFQNAYNEDRTKWYTEGTLDNDASQGNYSNYFLVKSTADNGGDTEVSLNVNSTTYPSDRTSATKAGSTKLNATNIDKIDGKDVTQLKDKVFSKDEANYQDAKLTADATTATTFYIYTADVPTWTTLPSGVGNKHIDYRYYTLNAQCKTLKEEPVVTLVPIYTSTLKSANHKSESIKGDGDKLSNLTFYGAKVTSKVSDENSNEVALGYLTSEQVVSAVKAAVKTKAAETGDEKYTVTENDELRGLLYLDLSALTSVDNTNFTDDFHKSTADNCLYIMYPGFHRDGVINTIAKKADDSYEAVSNITLYDQQPFFTPVAFKTGAYTVTYDREGTSDNSGAAKAKVRNMAVVLPFSVSLDDKGHIKTASDQTDEAITYHNITNSGDATSHSYGDATHDLTYAVVASAVTDGKAEANKPYYVTKADDAEVGFTYTIAAAEFAQSGTVDYDQTSVSLDKLTNEPTDAWKAIGSYSGAQPKKAENLWYFAKDYFWKSSQLKTTDHVNIRPFRAYFETTAKTNANSAKVVFDESEIQPTGISDVTADGTLQIAAGNGTLQIAAGADTHYTVVTVAGQLVANGLLTAGETRTISVAQGVYIVNNKKIIIK